MGVILDKGLPAELSARSFARAPTPIVNPIFECGIDTEDSSQWRSHNPSYSINICIY